MSRVPRLNVNKAILFFEKKTKGVFCMKFGNYKIDSFYLIMIIGLEKDDKEG